MGIRYFPALLVALASLVGCGESSDPAVGAASPMPGETTAATEIAPISGTYHVSGTTVEKSTGSERSISGTVILVEDGGRYTSTFSLSTTLTGHGEPQKAEVIGKGDGLVKDRTLEGTADTQLIIALVPGIDAGFAFMPRTATTRIRNATIARLGDDGSVQIEIESDPAPGEQDYRPTRTMLRGRRISAVGIGGDE